MPGGVIEVGRRERPGWIGRLDPLPLLGTLRITLRRRRAIRRARRAEPESSVGGARPPSAREPSAEQLALGAWPLRGMPVLVADAGGEPRCVACGLCERACPARCLEVAPGPHPTDPASRRPARFELDLERCLLCGLCEEACPERAIVMSSVGTAAFADRASLVFSLEALLVPADRLAAQLARLEAPNEAVVAPASEQAVAR